MIVKLNHKFQVAVALNLVAVRFVFIITETYIYVVSAERNLESRNCLIFLSNVNVRGLRGPLVFRK